MGCFSEFWVRFWATVAKLANELKVDRFSRRETVFDLKLQGVTSVPREGVERDTHLVTFLFVGHELGFIFPPLLSLDALKAVIRVANAGPRGIPAIRAPIRAPVCRNIPS